MAALLILLLALSGGVHLALSRPESVNHLLDPAQYFSGDGLALALAVDHLDRKQIDRLVYGRGVDPDTIFDRTGRPLLAWPVVTHNAEGLHLLLNAGASPNVRQITDGVALATAAETALVAAAAMTDPDYLTELLQRGGDPNARNADGEPLLYVAFVSGQWTNVQRLILSGANLDTTLYTEDGYDTVLSWYSRIGRFDRLYWLMEHGGDPTRRMHDLQGSRLAGTAESNEGRMPIVEDAYYRNVPAPMRDWQQACQSWLLLRGIGRPPMPTSLRPREQERELAQEPGKGAIAL